MKIVKVFSLITGEVIDLQEDELKNLDNHQVPLKTAFPRSCRKCYGRGYIGYITRPKISEKVLQPCMSCMKKCIDVSKLEHQKKEI